MPRKLPAEELSADELRHLLAEKRRAARQERLDHFRRTGRVVVLAPQEDSKGPGSVERVTGSPTGTEAKESTRARVIRRRKDALDKVLLFVEILAAAALVFTVIQGVRMLRDLNREVASALTQPTLTPTPLIVAVVLPSGHTPPNSEGGAQPNWDEIPEHLLPLVQILAEAVVPTPGPEHALRIQIPAIGVDAPIVQGDGWEQLKQGVGQLIGSANPGTNGNVVLSAHNDVYGEIFRDLDQLQPGDEVQVFTNQRTFHYSVVNSQVVTPDRVDLIAQTSEPLLTLVSCYPYMVDTQRIVISASLVQ